ncbi:MAG: CBS domain-containing protein [Candidatus Scalinduaceae bacterium]
MKIKKCMATKNIITAKETMGIKEAASLLTKHRISSVPVVDDQGSLIGIVSISDIVKTFLPDFVPLVDIDFVKDYGSLDFSAEDVKKIAAMTVSGIMTRKVYTVDEECSLVRALSMIKKHNVKALPVVRNGKLIGIVSSVDICRRFLEVWEDKNKGEN